MGQLHTVCSLYSLWPYPYTVQCEALVISDLYSTVNILKFAVHLCIYGSLYSTVESTLGLLMRGGPF